MTNWNFMFRFPAGHRYYRDADTGRIAVADDSIQDLSDPGSTDGGLLLLSRSLPADIDISRIKVYVTGPDHLESNGNWVIEPFENARPLIRMFRREGIPYTLSNQLIEIVSEIVDARLSRC